MNDCIHTTCMLCADQQALLNRLRGMSTGLLEVRLLLARTRSGSG